MEKLFYELDKLNDIPNSPGIYFMKDKDDRVIYVGKSKNLKNRVKSYFFKNKNHSKKIQTMVRNISHINIIKTDTEFDALLLECSYIHKIKPMYNTLLKDYDKYKYISLNKNKHNIVEIKEEIDDDSVYYGPYSFGSKIRNIKDIIARYYNLPICSDRRKCIRYDLNKCIAPCRFEIEEAVKYNLIESIGNDLDGKSSFILNKLEDEMNQEIKRLNFEKAAIIKNEIDLFNSIVKKQNHILNLQNKRNIIFWIKLEEKKYKIYYINSFEVKYEKNIDIKKFSKDDLYKVKFEIENLISKEDTSNKNIEKEKIDYINIINDYIRNDENRGYIVLDRKDENIVTK